MASMRWHGSLATALVSMLDRMLDGVCSHPCQSAALEALFEPLKPRSLKQQQLCKSPRLWNGNNRSQALKLSSCASS
eukprot:860747-Pleurochrysis_carterae.AAC.1